MNRTNAIDQRLELSSYKKTKFKPVKHFLIDYYLNGFKKRRRKTENVFIVCLNYFTLFLWFVSLSKFLVVQSFDLNIETKLILYDLSYLLGGIEFYNKIFLSLTCVMGSMMNYVFRISGSKASYEWTMIFDMTRLIAMRTFIARKHQDMMDLLVKLSRAMEVIYKLTSISFISLSEYEIKLFTLIFQCQFQ